MLQSTVVRVLAAACLIAAQLHPAIQASAEASVLASGAIVGIAQCGPTVLAGATIDLFSGASPVSTTTADAATAQYALSDLGPSTYTLRIKKGPVICGSAVNVQAGAVTNVQPPPLPIDLHNHSWTTAHALNPLAANGLPVAVDEYLLTRDQSAWFKFQVWPGGKVIASLSSLPANFDLALYKDIGATSLALSGTPDLTLLGAQFAPDAYSPDAYSPDAYSPDAYSPDAYSPDAYSPDAYSPDAYSPDAYSPDAYSPDAPLASKLASPPAPGGEPVSPGAFASAQTKSLVAISALDGTANELITRNTWANGGHYYVRVRGRQGAFSPAAPFHLEVAVLGGDCATVQSDLTAVSTSAKNTGLKTLVIADFGRFHEDVEVAPLQQALNTFVARPEVAGVVVDVGTDERVQQANLQADSTVACPYAKNLVASSIKDIVDAYRQSSPTIEYLVLIGADDIIPFFRYADETVLANEKGFAPPVYDDSPSQASLKLGNVLSDDGYGVRPGLSRSGSTFPLPDLAIGRLVERPLDIAGMLYAYMQNPNGVTPLTTQPFVSGYDFMADAAEAVRGELEAGTGRQAVSLIQPGYLPPTDPTAWTADQLKTAFLSGRHDLAFLAGHFGPASALAADYSTRLQTTDVVAAQVDMTNMIVFSPGCHSGYNVIDKYGIAGLSPSFDWAQAAARKRFTLIGGTGYQYGETDVIEYSERLYLEFSRQLRMGSGPVSVGKALVRAKQAYLAATPRLGAIHAKAVIETALFGLPHLSVNMPGARLTAAPDASIVGVPSPYTSKPGVVLGLTRADVTVTPTFAPHTAQTNGPGTPAATYFSGAQGVVTNPGEPILPLELRNVGVPGTVLRGVGLRSAPFTDQSDARPLTAAPATELRTARTPFVTDTPFPVKLWDVNYFDAVAGGATRLAVTPLQYFSSQSGAETGALRQFGPMSFRLFYSNNTETYGDNRPALSAAPAISRVAAVPEVDTRGSALLRFKVDVAGDPAAGMQEVWITYTATSGGLAGKWQSLDLARSPGESSTYWTGTLPLGVQPADTIRFMVQAVNGVGLVSLATNQGAYYAPASDRVLPAAPKAPTSIVLMQTPVSGAYQDQVTLSALLTSNAAPVAGRSVAFSLGAHRRRAVTNASGVATVTVPIAQSPGQSSIRVAFEETTDLLASSALSPFAITEQLTTLSFGPGASGALDADRAVLQATLKYGSGQRGLSQQSIVFSVTGAGRSFVTSAVTDQTGRALLRAVPLPAGTYTVTVSYGDTLALPNNATVSLPHRGYVPSQATTSLILPAGSPAPGR